MSQTLVASGRITVPYTIGGLTHRARAYCRNIQAGGATFKINSRALDANDIEWEDAADAWAQCIAKQLEDATVFGDAQLEQRSGSIWTLKSTHPVSPTAITGTFFPASQLTLTLRDTSFFKVKVVVLDTIATPPLHYLSATGGDANLDALIHYFLDDDVDPAAPFVWMVSRGNRYLADPGFVAATFTLNRRVRRRRGYV